MKFNIINKSIISTGITLLLYNCQSENKIEDLHPNLNSIILDTEVNVNTLKSKSSSQLLWSTNLCYNDNWRVRKHPRMTADVNGDGKADLINFGSNSVYVSLSTGSSFAKKVRDKQIYVIMIIRR